MLKGSITLLTSLFAVNAFAADADKLVLTLNDVNSQVKKIELYRCDTESNSYTPGCPERIEFTKRDGGKVQRTLAFSTASILNSTRHYYSSDLHEIFVEKRDAVCPIAPQYSRTLTGSYVHYVDHISFKIKSVESSKTLLGNDDCTQAEVIRPKSEEAYAETKKARDILIVLANELLN
jgi:hypothetical protein